MSKPNPLRKYPAVDLKLAIKSSLPRPKSVLALLVMIWRAADSPASIDYSQQNQDQIQVNEHTRNILTEKYAPSYEPHGVSESAFIEQVNQNGLITQQIEPLIVGLELVWRLAKVDFIENRPFSAERQKGIRFGKRLMFTRNMDILDTLLTSNEEEFTKVLLSWIGLEKIVPDTHYEFKLLKLLTHFLESAIYRLKDGADEIIFNLNSIYEPLINGAEIVNINDTDEPKGPLRILRNALSDGMHPYLSYNSGNISAIDLVRLENYQRRVENYLSLKNALHLINEGADLKFEDPSNLEIKASPPASRKTGGQNILLYGVPGSGKSYTVKEQYCSDEARIERLVFHPDYTYSDFIGQILPRVESGMILYRFIAGPFTRILKKATEHPLEDYYLIIEEINRGNAPAIFGDVFQLLDRDEHGRSQYGISNSDIAEFVHGNPWEMVRIPSNLSVIGTMNTSDQNVYTLDNAFQRRWQMQMIENTFDKVPFANEVIVDTTVTWKNFNEVINEVILREEAGFGSTGDKRLGVFFVSQADFFLNPDDLHLTLSTKSSAATVLARRFAEKVLKYLWDDVFKFSREALFDIERFASLEMVVNHFAEQSGDSRFLIFHKGILSTLVPQGIPD